MQEEKSCLTAGSHRTSEVGSLLSSCTQKQQACWWRVTMLLPGVPRNDFPNSFRCATGWWFRPRSEQPETPATAKCPDNHHCPRAQLHPEQLCPTTPSRHRAMKQRNPMQKYIMEGWSKSFLSDFSPLPHKQGMQVYPLSDSDHHRNGLHSHETHQPPCTQPFQPLPLQGWGSLESHLSLFVPVSHTETTKKAHSKPKKQYQAWAIPNPQPHVYKGLSYRFNPKFVVPPDPQNWILQKVFFGR